MILGPTEEKSYIQSQASNLTVKITPHDAQPCCASCPLAVSPSLTLQTIIRACMFTLVPREPNPNEIL